MAITQEKINAVRNEMERLNERFKAYEAKVKEQEEWNKKHYPDKTYHFVNAPAETGAIKRASMDLSRTLAKLRSSKL